MGCGPTKEADAEADETGHKAKGADVEEREVKEHPPMTKDEEREARLRTKIIDQQIQLDRIKDLTIIKVLLLGGPSSGKTTIFKQMRILHLNGFTESDYVNYRYIIHSNAVTGLQKILEAARSLKLPLSPTLREDVVRFGEFVAQESVGNHEIDEEIGRVMSRLWRSDPAQGAWEKRFQFNFLESTRPFLDELERLSEASYRPSTMDILLARFRTTGIYEMSFLFNDLTLRMVDVGGQKSEQKKWIHCFDNVQMLLFVASLADYDLNLEEEPSTNRMLHSVEIFRNLCVSQYFKETAFILFLNKKDVFSEKILASPLTICFEGYQGADVFDEASAYILGRFVAEFPAVEGKRLYGHFTTATNTDNVNKVFDDCMHQILRQNMSNAGVA